MAKFLIAHKLTPEQNNVRVALAWHFFCKGTKFWGTEILENGEERRLNSLEIETLKEMPDSVIAIGWDRQVGSNRFVMDLVDGKFWDILLLQ